jgi:hypothetical protein
MGVPSSVWDITLDLAGGGFFFVAAGGCFLFLFFFVLFFAAAADPAFLLAADGFLAEDPLADFPDDDDLGIISYQDVDAR